MGEASGFKLFKYPGPDPPGNPNRVYLEAGSCVYKRAHLEWIFPTKIQEPASK